MHKILLAEDDNDMRRFLVKALENAGFQVSSHDNGLSAYQRLREEPFEMLLTDIVMPEMDGIELARRASELDPDIKIMFITGFAAVALNSDSEAPEERQGAGQAGPSSRIGQRSEQDAGGLIRTPDPRQTASKTAPKAGPKVGLSVLACPLGSRYTDATRHLRPLGRVAQRESTSLTSRGSQVRSLSRPPSNVMMSDGFPAA